MEHSRHFLNSHDAWEMMFVCVNEWVLANDSYSVQNRPRLVLKTDSGWGGEGWDSGAGLPQPLQGTSSGSATAQPAALGTQCAAVGLMWGLVSRRGITCGAFLSGHKSCNLFLVHLHWKCLSAPTGFIGVMLE